MTGATVKLGATSLMYACQQGKESQVIEIIKAKPDTILERERSLKTALHYCAESGDGGVESAAALLKVAPELVSAADQDGYTALHLAVIAGNVQLAKLLIAHGADVNTPDNEGHTSAHWATVCGEMECLELILKKKGEPNLGDMHGGCPLHYAAQMCGAGSGMPGDRRLGMTALRLLINHAANPNIPDHHGRQPILWAASAGSTEAILVLTNAGANVEASDKDGLTALHCAASRGHTDCVETLISLCNAEADVIDNNGCSPLFYAVTLGHADSAQALLNHGANTNRQDRKGRTAMHCGAAKGQMETLKVVWNRGGNLWSRTARGDYPLHEAVTSGRCELVSWLLSLRPDAVNAPNNDGRCPLHLAAVHNNVEMCKVLLDAGSLVNPVMRTGKGLLATPLDAALHKGHRGTAKYLQLHGGVPAARLNSEFAALRGSNSRKSGTQNQQIIEGEKDNMAEPLSTPKPSPLSHQQNVKFPDQKQKILQVYVEDGLMIKRIKHSQAGEMEDRVRRRRRKRKTRYPQENNPFSREKDRQNKGYEESTDEEGYTSPTSSLVETRQRSDSDSDLVQSQQSLDKKENEDLVKKVDLGSVHEEESKTLKENIQQVEVEFHRAHVSDDQADKYGTSEVQDCPGLRGKGEDNPAVCDGPSLTAPEKGSDRVESMSTGESLHISQNSHENIITNENDELIDSDSKEKCGILIEKSDEENIQLNGTDQQIALEKSELQSSENAIERHESTEEVSDIANEEEGAREEVAELTEETQMAGAEPLLSNEENQTKEGESVDETSNTIKLETLKESEEPHEDEDRVKIQEETEDIDYISKNNEALNEAEKNVQKIPTEIFENEDAIDEIHKRKISNEEIIENNVDAEGDHEQAENDLKLELYDSLEEEAPSSPRKSNETASELYAEEGATLQKQEESQSDSEKYTTENNATEEAKHSESVQVETGDSIHVVEDSEKSGKEETNEDTSIVANTTDEDVIHKHKSDLEETKAENEDLNLNEQVAPPLGDKTDIVDDASGEKGSVVKHSSLEQEQAEEDLGVENIVELDEEITSRGYAHEMRENETGKLLQQVGSEGSIEKTFDDSEKERESKSVAHEDRGLIKVLSEEKGSFDLERQSRRRTKRKEWSQERSIQSWEPGSISPQQEEYNSQSGTRSPSQIQDSGIEPSPQRARKVKGLRGRSKSRIPRMCRKEESDIEDDMPISTVSVTQAVQFSVRKYHLERRIFHQLLELKRLQIRAGRASESVLVKRLVDDYKRAGLMLGLQQYNGVYTFRAFEKYLYDQLRLLQSSERRIIPRLKSSDDLERLTSALRKTRAGQEILTSIPNNPVLCTYQTHRCHHATHAYTGIPCAAYIRRNHHTMPKAGSFLPRLVNGDRSGELAKTLRFVDPARPLTLELSHGSEKQVITLPTEKLDKSKRYFVTFTIKTGNQKKREGNHGHIHASSV